MQYFSRFDRLINLLKAKLN